MFTGRTDAEAETPILWPPDVKSHFTGKDPDAGKDWGQEEKRITEDKIVGEDKMVGSHHWLSGHEFEQTLGDSEGQGSLAWGHKESDMTEWLNNNKLIILTNLGDFLVSPVVKNLPANSGDGGSIPDQVAEIPHAAGQLSLRTTTREKPVCCN